MGLLVIVPLGMSRKICNVLSVVMLLYMLKDYVLVPSHTLEMELHVPLVLQVAAAVQTLLYA